LIFLIRTYESFLANTDYPREKLELILCDDGSPFEIQEDMKKLKFDKYLFAKKNDGMAKNVNKGILAANGEYILQLQDDWFCKGPSDYLKLGVRALKENPELGLIRYRLGMEYLYTSKLFNNGLK
jgi:GT2 family glycosyltransferase